MVDQSDIFKLLAESADACEQSWSLTPDETEERVLFFFENSVEAAKLIATAAQQLNIPDKVLSEWSFSLPGADAIGLALRCDRASVRLYTQYWEVLAARVNAGNHDPFPLYRGFKSLPDGTVRTDSYHCLPLAPEEAFWPPMAEAFAAQGLDPLRAREVFADLTPETAIFTRTMGSGRVSWLTTVRRAEINRAALADWAAPLSAVPKGAEILDRLANDALVHLAGGHDAQKGPFFTIYTESSPEAVLASLARFT